MEALLKRWEGNVDINNVAVDVNALDFTQYSGPICIHLSPKGMERVNERGNNVADTITKDLTLENDVQYRIKVRQWMTKATEPGSTFTFMQDMNKNIPMPMRVMVGTVVKSTARMVYMRLHGEITEAVTQCCMKCGRPITNPVSKLFGMGPECGGHNYTNPFNTEEELREAVHNYNTRLRNITWEGWIAKSAIEEQEVFNGVD